MNFGDFELKSYEELKNDKDYQFFISDIYNNKCKNGESFIDYRTRVVSAFNTILDNSNKNIVIVTHGGTIFYILNNLFKEDKNIYDLQIDNG